MQIREINLSGIIQIKHHLKVQNKNEVFELKTYVFDLQRHISPSALSVFIYMHYSIFDGITSISNKEIQYNTGLSKNTVTKSVKELNLFGLISLKRRARKNTIFSVSDDTLVFQILKDIENIKKEVAEGMSLRGTIPPEVRENVLRKSFYKCTVCKSKRNLEIDHIIPVSRGGGDEESNLQTLCKTCNVSKSNNDMDFWLENR